MVPKDYKERPARRKSAPRKARKSAPVPSRWPVFLSGACVGVVLTAAAFLYEPGPGVERIVQGALPSTDKEAVDESRPKFEFYTVLPEKEILIPERSLDEPPARGASSESAATTGLAEDDSTRYVLQVASLRKLEDADSLKARLALLGLQSSIQTVSVDGSETWHRVRVGPFTGRAALNDARAQLKRNDFDVLVMKLK
jgi:cell division protein FtsN